LGAVSSVWFLGRQKWVGLRQLIFVYLLQIFKQKSPVVYKQYCLAKNAVDGAFVFMMGSYTLGLTGEMFDEESVFDS
jgi:hypothetical protein